MRWRPAVIDALHESLGEQAAAVVTLRQGAGAPSCARTSRSAPRRTDARGAYGLVEELLKGPTGKVRKREIAVPDSEPASSGD